MKEKKGYKALLNYVLISPKKIRRLANCIRRKPYSEAIALLEVLPHKGARILRKVLISAASNAIYNNKNIDEDSLFVKKVLINDGPRMKRVWIRGRGRADILLKRMSNIYIEVDEIKEGGKRGSES
jgi:large subunit ribosomal protein L22